MPAVKKTATYHADLTDARQLLVIAENDDGTVDLGRAVDGEKKPALVVGKCPQSTEPKRGHCTLNVTADSAATPTDADPAV